MPQPEPTPEFQHIPLARLDETENDPRLHRVRGARIDVDALVPSIRTLGILEPLVVRPQGDRFEILAGRRRSRAAKKAGLETVPCVVRDCDDEEAHSITLTENLQRVQLHPLQEAEGLARLSSEGQSVAEIAATIGVSEATVHRRLALRSLASEVRKAFTDPQHPASGWSLRHLELLATYPEATQQSVVRSAEDGYFMTLDSLRKELERSSCALASVPWSLDDADLLPSASACSTCPHRSGATPSLFADLDTELAAEDHCLNSICFEDKQRAHLVVTFKEAQKKHGDDLVAITQLWYIADSAPALGVEIHPRNDQWAIVKKSKKGAVPAFHIDEGKVVWITFAKDSQSAQKSDSIEAKLERSETLLRRKRLRHAVPALLEAGAEAEPPSPDVLLRLVGLFGGVSNEISRGWTSQYEWPESFTKATKDQPSPLWTLVEVAPDDEALALQTWGAVQWVFGERLNLKQSFDDFDCVEAEAAAYGRLVGLDWSTFWSTAREAHPPSKALVKRREEVRGEG